MNLREVLHVVGGLLVSAALAMAPCALVSIGEGLLGAWAVAIGISAGLGAALWLSTPRRVFLNPREALAIVGLGWIAIVHAGAVPFLTTGVAPTPAAALFESVSGFTTTGATVFAVVEALPRSILLWRSVTHWIGGMGIIVLGVAILPLIGVGGAQLFRAEAPGIATDRIQPRIASTARLLWSVYLLFTALLASLYVLLGMSVFEAVNHAMSALATGGFSTRTASLAAFSPAIQWVTILFMFAAGVNFTLHYRFLAGEWRTWFQDVEWRWYVGSIAVVTVVCFGVLGLGGGEWSAAGLRRALFNVVAIHSTTGFATDDFAAWPAVCLVLFVGMMFMGAMGGSTGGGFKVVRGAVVTQHVLREVRKVVHPRAIIVTRLGRHPIRPEVVLNVLAFLALYMFTHAAGTIALAALGNDLVTSLSASLAALSSIGPGLGAVGPASHYGDLGSAAHLLLAVLMLLGRLEFYTLLVLLMPETWVRDRRRRASSYAAGRRPRAGARPEERAEAPAGGGTAG
ncbi:MAG: TrkH family potassium uptake protein [Gemmatimonadota bacterium]